METIELSDNLIRKINDVALDAGNKVISIYEKDFNVQQKSDSSPLTEADLASHQCIVDALSSIAPVIPILSEESADISWAERSAWRTYWLIDPLDGTKEFIKKNGEFTINIALIENGTPVFGSVYAPVLEELYFGGKDIGAWKQTASQKQSISVARSSNPTIRVVGSRSHQSEDIQNYLKQFSNYELVPMGSSLKICLIAEGKADIYPRLGPTSEWDTAAAHAVLKAAGGTCVLYDNNQELMYNTKDSLLNPYFIAQGPTL